MPTPERCTCGHKRLDHLMLEGETDCLRHGCDCTAFTSLNPEQIVAFAERLAQGLGGRLVEEVYTPDDMARIAREVVTEMPRPKGKGATNG